MLTLTLIEKIFICYLCVLMGFGLANIMHQTLKYDFIQPTHPTEKKTLLLSVERAANEKAESTFFNSAFKPSSKEIDNYFYDKIIPMQEKEINNMKLYNVYLGENSDRKDALGGFIIVFLIKILKVILVMHFIIIIL